MQASKLASTILKGSVVLMATQAIGALLYFVAQRIILSTLSIEANGHLFVERRVADLLMVIFVDMGLNGLALRAVSVQPQRAKEVVTAMVVVRLVLGLFTSAMVFGVTAHSSYSVVAAVTWCGYLLISSRSSLLRYSMEVPARAQVKYMLTSAVTILDAVMFVAILFFWRHSNLNPEKVTLAFLLSAVPGFLIVSAVYGRRYVSFSHVRWTDIKDLLVQAIPLALSIVLVNIHDKADAMILEKYGGFVETGIFGAAYTIVNPVTSNLPIAVSLALAPNIARMITSDFETSKRYSITALRFLFVTGVVVSALLSSATPIIIELVTKGKYASTMQHFFAMLWMPVAVFVIVFVQEINVAIGKQRNNLAIAIVLCVLTISTGLALIPSFGAWGAVLSKLITIGVAASTAAYMFIKIFGYRVDLLLCLRAVILVAIASTVAWQGALHLAAPLAASVCAIVTILVAAALRFITIDDIRLVRRLLSQK